MAYTLILSTCPSEESSRKIARALLEEGLCACVQMMPIQSMYIWQDKVCDGAETLLLIKSKSALFEEISARIVALHEYELPEIIEIPITGGLPGYLEWIERNTK